MNIDSRYIKFITIGLLATLLLVFIVQNAALVEFKFLFWSITMRRAVMILSVFAIGFIFAWVIRGFLAHREINRWRKRYINLENYRKARYK